MSIYVVGAQNFLNPDLTENLQNLVKPRQWLIDAIAINSGQISIHCDRICWCFYFVQGKLVYASHSIDSFERLERHLRRLSREVPQLNDKVRSQLRLQFDGNEGGETDAPPAVPPEYYAICSLVNEGFLTKTHAQKLIARMVQEVVETFCCLPSLANQPSTKALMQLPSLYCVLELSKLLEVIDQRLKVWRELGPSISSPFQCPHLVNENQAGKSLSPEVVQRLSKLLRGFNLRQLSALLDKSELTIAQQLMPLIRDGAIVLKDPISPFDMLPRTYIPTVEEDEEVIDTISQVFAEDEGAATISISQVWRNNPQEKPAKTWKIACIDDSPAMLNEIERLLSSDEFAVHTINDSMKALMRLASIRPDLILMDVGMPNVDGYQLCSLIRKATMLRDIPIVMVTGHKGLLDRAKAKMAGANDYLTKPFTKNELLKMVMRHLL
ncbi:MAG: response regulator [Pseudanabaena sp. ELA607]|jgi:twitching motility two-component system response regulator PilG